MQVAAAQLSAQLQRGLRPLYTLFGDEPLLVQEAADAIRAAARAQGYTERSSFTVAGAHFDWSAVLAAGSALSLFASRQIIDIHIPSGKPGKDGSQALQQLAQAAAGQTDCLTLLRLPRLDKLSKSSAWFQALEGGGVTVQLDPVERPQLPAWMAQRLARQGQKVADGDEGQHSLQVLADRVEGNLLAAHQEIQKLGLLYPAGVLSLEQIERAVLNVARFDVFKLTEAVLAGQLPRVQRMLDGLRGEGVAEVLVHYTLAEEIRSLRRVKQAVATGRPLAMALREWRIWGVRERLYERLVPRLSPTQLDQLLQAAHQVDGLVKGLKHPDWPTDPWQGLQRLALQLCLACRSERMPV